MTFLLWSEAKLLCCHHFVKQIDGGELSLFTTDVQLLTATAINALWSPSGIQTWPNIFLFIIYSTFDIVFPVMMILEKNLLFLNCQLFLLLFKNIQWICAIILYVTIKCHKLWCLEYQNVRYAAVVCLQLFCARAKIHWGPKKRPAVHRCERKDQFKGGELDARLSDCHEEDAFMRFSPTSGKNAFDKCAPKPIAEFLSACV